MSIEGSPEHQKAFTEAAEKQYRGYLYGGGYAKTSSKDKIAETMEGIQRQRREIERTVVGAKGHANLISRDSMMFGSPHMMEITRNLSRKHGVSRSLVCPKCDGGSLNNTMNGRPWCMKCDLPLMTPEKAEEWEEPKKTKSKGYTLNEPEDVVRAKK